MENKPTFIDLFAGAGGLSEGFIRAGFQPVAHVEMDKDSCETIKTRTAYHYLKEKGFIQEYIGFLKNEISRERLHFLVPQKYLDTVINEEINTKSLNKIFNKIYDNLKICGKKKIDVIIGGPPCQSYSFVTRMKDNKRGRRNKKFTERKYLYKLYGRFLKKFKPKFFIFENVPGLYSAEDGKYYNNLIKYFKRIGYCVEDQELDASDFGVLQKRKRVIIIGWKKKLKFKYPRFNKIKNKWNIKDLFHGLPEIGTGFTKNLVNYSTEIANKYLRDFEIRNGFEFVTQHITRTHNKNDLEIYEMAIDKWMRNKVRIKYTDLPEKNRTQKNTDSFLDRFKVVDYNGHSHTLVAHIAKDGHYYIHPDKNQLRSISVREAARIQSFPDDYFFEGSRTSIFKQIGNAVPPLMSVEIAKHIKKKFRIWP